MSFLQAQARFGTTLPRQTTLCSRRGITTITNRTCSLRPATRTVGRLHITQQERTTSFLHDTSTNAGARHGADTSKTTYTVPNKLDKGKRSKISTLATDHLARADLYGYESESSWDAVQQERLSANTRTFSRKSRRRLILVSSVIFLFLFGRDVLEVVVPGTIGSLLYLASYVKAVIRWVKSIGNENP